MEKYTAPDTHRRPIDADAFIASLNENEQMLHEMAARILGSSYFMDRTHSYAKWKKLRT